MQCSRGGASHKYTMERQGLSSRQQEGEAGTSGRERGGGGSNGQEDSMALVDRTMENRGEMEGWVGGRRNEKRVGGQKVRPTKKNSQLRQ